MSDKCEQCGKCKKYYKKSHSGSVSTSGGSLPHEIRHFYEYKVREADHYREMYRKMVDRRMNYNDEWWVGRYP